MSQALLSIRSLEVRFPAERPLLRRPRRFARAVDGVDLDVGAGETVALVGESGCGKTTLARALLRLVEPACGEIWLRPPPQLRRADPALEALVADAGADGALDLARIPERLLRPVRRILALVFQGTAGALDPRQRAWRIVAEPLEIHRIARGAELRRRAAALLERVGLPPQLGERFPHALSGGQRQRLGIARALSLDPALVVCDEAVSALDASVKAQILELLVELQRERGLSYLFISHDLAVVRQVARRTAVMYAGQIVEEGPTERLFSDPRHPYTRALLQAVPVPDPLRRRERLLLLGEPPSPADPPPGCRFHPRCPVVLDRCRAENPPALPLPGGGRAACFLAGSPLP